MNKSFISALNTLPLAAAVGISAHAAYRIYQHTFNVENECKKQAFYGDLTTPFDESTQAAVDKVVDKILFFATPKQVALTQFYWSNKPTIQSMGSTQSRFGTFIGIPVNFKYKAPSEVELSSLESELVSSKENTELLQRLRGSLVLSENAKKFAISSEFFTAHSSHLFAKVNGITMIVGAYLTAKYLFLPYLEAASPAVGFTILLGIALLWIVVHYCLCGFYYRYLRASSDRKTAQLGDDFMQGGLEYLQKVSEKNKLLRELDPSTAGLMFKSNGDEIQGVFDIGELSLSERMNQLQEIEKKQQAKGSSSDTVESSDS